MAEMATAYRRTEAITCISMRDGKESWRFSAVWIPSGTDTTAIAMVPGGKQYISDCRISAIAIKLWPWRLILVFVTITWYSWGRRKVQTIMTALQVLPCVLLIGV